MSVLKRTGLMLAAALLLCVSAAAVQAGFVTFDNRAAFTAAGGNLTTIDFEGRCANDGYVWFHNQSISGVLFQGHGGYVWNTFPSLHIFGPDLFPPEKPTDWNSGCVLVGPGDGWIYAKVPAGTKSFGTDVMTYRVDQWGPNETVLAATYGFQVHAAVKFTDGSEELFYHNPTLQRPNRAFWGIVADKEIDYVYMWADAGQNARIVWDNTTFGYPNPWTIYSNRNQFFEESPILNVIDFEGRCANNGYVWFHNQSIDGVLFQGHGGYVWNTFPNLHIFGPDLFPPEKPTDWNSGCVLVGPGDGWIYAKVPAGTKWFGADIMTYRVDQWGQNETVLAATYGFQAHAAVKFTDGSEELFYYNPTLQRPNRAFWGIESDKEIDYVYMWADVGQNARIVWDNVAFGPVSYATFRDRSQFLQQAGSNVNVIDFEGRCANDSYVWFHNQSISGVLFQGHGGYVWNNFPNLHIFGPDLFPPEKPTDWNSGCVLVGPADGWVYADLPAGTKAFGTDVMTYRVDQWGPNETVLAATYGFHAHAWVKYGDGSEGLYYWNPTFQRPNRAFWGLVSDKEIDWVAMWSTAGQNAYIVWDNTTFGLAPGYELINIRQAKMRADAQQVHVVDKVVTAAFDDFFYIEEPDRTAGIRVVRPDHDQLPGDRVQIIGVMRTASSGERYIDATTGMVDYVIGTPLQPLGMNNRSLGGSSFGESPVWQAGVADGVGPNNIGLLIRTTGRVLESGSGWFTISDGSGVTVKVIGTAPAGTPYVVVTGISSLESPNGNRVVLAVNVQTIPE